MGVPGVAAEAELLAAIALFLERVGLSAQDIVIKISSRKVLQAILERFGVPEDAVGPVSVILDKMEKIPLEKVNPMCCRLYSLCLSTSLHRHGCIAKDVRLWDCSTGGRPCCDMRKVPDTEARVPVVIRKQVWCL